MHFHSSQLQNSDSEANLLVGDSTAGQAQRSRARDDDLGYRRVRPRGLVSGIVVPELGSALRGGRFLIHSLRQSSLSLSLSVCLSLSLSLSLFLCLHLSPTPPLSLSLSTSKVRQSNASYQPRPVLRPTRPCCISAFANAVHGREGLSASPLIAVCCEIHTSRPAERVSARADRHKRDHKDTQRHRERHIQTVGPKRSDQERRLPHRAL